MYFSAIASWGAIPSALACERISTLGPIALAFPVVLCALAATLQRPPGALMKSIEGSNQLAEKARRLYSALPEQTKAAPTEPVEASPKESNQSRLQELSKEGVEDSKKIRIWNAAKDIVRAWLAYMKRSAAWALVVPVSVMLWSSTTRLKVPDLTSLGAGSLVWLTFLLLECFYARAFVQATVARGTIGRGAAIGSLALPALVTVALALSAMMILFSEPSVAPTIFLWFFGPALLAWFRRRRVDVLPLLRFALVKVARHAALRAEKDKARSAEPEQKGAANADGPRRSAVGRDARSAARSVSPRRRAARRS
ncbi:hypothetical protein AUCHE_08_01030 [Austwickia chelonae NBRC 105200]|uniref:Uncharacterized protein n=2 Tax=Austwickia TaxID=1184606 RepID=K6UM72_9MICO|nr:hypothetical protein AUCHE_08_01030 [Austwickia chelonae NBRC 105200]